LKVAKKNQKMTIKVIKKRENEQKVSDKMDGGSRERLTMG
jgi:hypothetical protein